MQDVPARLHFAGATQVCFRYRDAVEQIGAEDDAPGGDDLAELQGERVEGALELAGEQGPRWLEAIAGVDADMSRLGGTETPLTWRNTGTSRTLEFPGYAYTRKPSALSGALMTVYDPTRPEVWKIPLYEEITPALTVKAPRGGYLIPPAHAAWLAEKLRLHGIRFTRLETPFSGLEAEVYRATEATFGKEPNEGHLTLTVKGSWAADRIDAPAGALFVPIAQPAARLVLHLLEPGAPDSLLGWGFFNAHFERKEYMEPYVAEQAARAMLAQDPALEAAFFQRLGQDEAFAKDPTQRLEFFYRRHPSWDTRYNVYPVTRLVRVPGPGPGPE